MEGLSLPPSLLEGRWAPVFKCLALSQGDVSYAEQ